MITQEFLRSVLHYSPETGEFTWINSRRSGWNGKKAGSKLDGYLAIKIDGIRYLSHRLAWLYVNGEFPDGEIDHINVSRTDNRIENLRLAGDSGNSINRPKTKANTSGYKGVYWHHRSESWMVIVTKNRVRSYLGLFKDKDVAGSVSREARKVLHAEFFNDD